MKLTVKEAQFLLDLLNYGGEFCQSDIYTAEEYIELKNSVAKKIVEEDWKAN